MVDLYVPNSWSGLQWVDHSSYGPDSWVFLPEISNSRSGNTTRLFNVGYQTTTLTAPTFVSFTTVLSLTPVNVGRFPQCVLRPLPVSIVSLSFRFMWTCLCSSNYLPTFERDNEDKIITLYFVPVVDSLFSPFLHLYIPFFPSFHY